MLISSQKYNVFPVIDGVCNKTPSYIGNVRGIAKGCQLTVNGKPISDAIIAFQDCVHLIVVRTKEEEYLLRPILW